MLVARRRHVTSDDVRAGVPVSRAVHAPHKPRAVVGMVDVAKADERCVLPVGVQVDCGWRQTPVQDAVGVGHIQSVGHLRGILRDGPQRHLVAGHCRSRRARPPVSSLPDLLAVHYKVGDAENVRVTQPEAPAGHARVAGPRTASDLGSSPSVAADGRGHPPSRLLSRHCRPRGRALALDPRWHSSWCVEGGLAGPARRRARTMLYRLPVAPRRWLRSVPQGGLPRWQGTRRSPFETRRARIARKPEWSL